MNIEPDRDSSDAEEPIESMMPTEETEQANVLSKEALPRRPYLGLPFPANFINKERIRTLSVAELLLPHEPSPCWDEQIQRYYISGKASAETVRDTLVDNLKELAESTTLYVGLHGLRATQDFVEELLSAFYFKDSPFREIRRGKQLVFYGPDYTTLLSISRFFESKGETNNGCMVVEVNSPMTMVIVGYLEPYTEKLLSYIRENHDVTASGLVEAGFGVYAEQITGKLSELWDMGVVRRAKTKRASDKARKLSYSYNPYHPHLDYAPYLPAHARGALEYDLRIVPGLRRRPKSS